MTGSGDNVVPLRSAKAARRRCPMCGKPTDEDYRPFCSKRCADLDLGQWLDGRYAVPAAEEDTPDQDDN